MQIATACRNRIARDVERIRSLVSWGEDYASKELEKEDVTGWDALCIQSQCKRALEQELDEHSDRDDARDIVDEILDEQLGDESDEEPL